MKLFLQSPINVFIACYFMNLLSCQSPNESQYKDHLSQNLAWAGNNRKELEKVLQHYQEYAHDSLKYSAAIFLISNMEFEGQYAGTWMDHYDSIFQFATKISSEPGLKHLNDSFVYSSGPKNDATLKFQNDLRTLSADFLIRNIDEAFASWQQVPWKSRFSFNTFCNFILPYRMLNEPTDSNWRSSLKAELQQSNIQITANSLIDDICCDITEFQKKWFKYTEVFSEYPSTLSLKNIRMGQKGACGEMAVLGAYANRALGIPVAIDYVPQWGNHTNGHIWNALFVADDSTLPFLGAESRPGDYSDIRESEGKIAKVFRRYYGYNEMSFAAQAKSKNILHIPAYIKSPRIRDVTQLYVPAKNISITLDAPDFKPVYLCIFQNGNWNAISGSWATHGKAFFPDMGPEVLYMPMYYESNKYQTASAPVIMTINDSLRTFRPASDSKIRMSCFRKYPIKKFRARFTSFSPLIGSRFEGSNNPDFSPAQLLYTISDSEERYKRKVVGGYTIRDELDYKSFWEIAHISYTVPFRYIRLVGKSGNPFKIGELAFYSTADTSVLQGIPIGNVSNTSTAFDGWNGYNIEEDSKDTTRYWVGLDLGKPTQISQIHYLPANDHNTVTPGKNYELYYWNDRWLSLGKRKATSHRLEFDMVPSGTIYWLHCSDCNSNEERPFTYESGNQVWW